MTFIIRNRQVVEDDWQIVGDTRAAGKTSQDAAVAEIGPVADLPKGKIFVPLAYWQACRAALVASRAKSELAVWLAADDEPADVVASFDEIALLGVSFPVFRDGRSMSNARLLRERYGWRGEIRALGDVQRDQLAYMSRCGIDAFAVRADKDIHDALQAFAELTLHYQGGVDDPRPLFRRVVREPLAPVSPT